MREVCLTTLISNLVKGGIFVMGKRKKYFIPAEKLEGLPEKLQNGKTEFDSHMIGAFYGSSVEVSVSYSINKSNGDQKECYPDTALQDALTRKLRHGDFAALKSETQSVLPEVTLARTIYEVKTLEEATAMRQTVDRFMSGNILANNLRYVTSQGQPLTYDQLMQLQASHKASNDELQKSKDKLIQDTGAVPTFYDGKWHRPQYSEELLNGLAAINRRVWSPTGYWLQLTFTVTHTIAKEGGYLTGSLTQDQLDEMASMLDYKETRSYWRGSIQRNKVSIPIQSLQHVTQVVKYVSDNHPAIKEWPKSVISSGIKLNYE